MLLRHDPSPVTRLNRAVALAQLGPEQAEVALGEVDALADRLDGYHLFHATRAELLDRLGRESEAALANARALELTTNDAERRLLTTRLHRHPRPTAHNRIVRREKHPCGGPEGAFHGGLSRARPTWRPPTGGTPWATGRAGA